MKNIVNLKKIKALPIVLILTLMMVLVSTSVYADNDDSNTKAVNVIGYEYVNNTTLKIFFDKGLVNLDPGQFKIKTQQGGSPVTITNMSSVQGSGWTNYYSPKGTIVTLTTEQLDPNVEYTITVSSTIQMGNTTLLTLGNYLLHKDVEFDFRTPQSDGTYSGYPTLKVLPTGTDAGTSANVMIISDEPIDTSSFNLSDVKLQKNGQDVIIDTTLDTVETTNAECYAAQINDAHTCIFIPETLKGGTPSYNLLSDNTQYTLLIPNSMQSTANTYDDFEDTDYTFTTGEDTAANMNFAPSVTGYTANSVSLSWADVTDYSTFSTGPLPEHYYVYYSTNPYFGFVKATDTVNESGNPNTCTVTGLSSATTYYFRIVPVNSAYEEGGFSPYVSQVTN